MLETAAILCHLNLLAAGLGTATRYCPPSLYYTYTLRLYQPTSCHLRHHQHQIEYQRLGNERGPIPKAPPKESRQRMSWNF